MAKRRSRSNPTMAKHASAMPADRRGGRGRKKARAGNVIRDSFTMPEADYGLIGALKKKCLRLGIAIKKSELVRAGLALLARLSDESLAQVAGAVESVKTGRPPGVKKKKKQGKNKKRRAEGNRR